MTRTYVMYLNLTEQVSSLEILNNLDSFMAEQRSRMPSGYRGRVNGLDGSGMLSPMDESLKVATILLFYLPALLSFLSSLPSRRRKKSVCGLCKGGSRVWGSTPPACLCGTPTRLLGVWCKLLVGCDDVGKGDHTRYNEDEREVRRSGWCM